ncbi:hypothetical protein VTJ83DRAFT_4534 [Remersonia thermophila]|uniref:Uncharacterized protein n=1 Tax=Remersonia thermophila TaxID=72144 RepID=A0ABR4DCD4_9PEZI
MEPTASLVAMTANPNGSRPPGSNASKHDSFFKSVQWSADGTTLFTSSYSNRICTFVVPHDLLEPRDAPLELAAHSTTALPEPTNVLAPCPYFDLGLDGTQAFLVAPRDHPIQLRHAFGPSPDDGDGDGDGRGLGRAPDLPPIANFHLIKRETEAYLPVTSLVWPYPGTHFVVGTANLIALYDVSRPDNPAARPQPVASIPTIPSTRHLAKGGGVGMRGTVSALAVAAAPASDARGHHAADGLLAAGTWTRHMGLYDVGRSNRCVATWSVAGAAASAFGGVDVGGKGVMQAAWSPCGRYLLVNERCSTGLLVYDVRYARRLLAVLEGRDAMTNQRLSCDVLPGLERVGGFEVWAGTAKGGAVVYEGVGNSEGRVEPSWGWQAHGSAVGATAVHPRGSVVATCEGSWRFREEEDDDDDDEEEEAESEDSEESSGSESSEDESESDASDDIEDGSPRSNQPQEDVEEPGPEPTHPQAAVKKAARVKKPKVYLEETSMKIWSIT